ncbi:MAG TPA: M48 family metalloprotease [Xanthobacteraceae bacterium]|nr:M48 family metalloprotease [Xanthobacteraceae bacterium]
MLRAFGLNSLIRSNAIKSVIVLFVFPLLLPAIVFVIGLIVGLLRGGRDARVVDASSSSAFTVFLIVAVIMLFWVPIAYFINQWIIDRATNARPLTRAEETRVWNLLENLCIGCGMRVPALRIIESEALNAFAGGVSEYSHSITLTRGLLNSLTDAELEGVLAHELTHIRNRDVQLLVATTIIAGAAPLACDLVVVLFRGLVAVVFVPLHLVGAWLPDFGQRVSPLQRLQNGIVALVGYVLHLISEFLSMILNLFLSRRREFTADAGAVELTKNPDALISALRKVSGHSDIPTRVAAVREMFFDNPHLSGLEGLIATHPPIERRIDALLKSGRNPAPATASATEPKVPQPVQWRAAASKLAPHVLPETQPASKTFAPPSPPEPELRDIAPLTASPRGRTRRLTVDYYPLLSRAVSLIENNTPDARKLLYARARLSLVSHLRQSDPPFTDSELSAEHEALDDAIERIESPNNRVKTAAKPERLAPHSKERAVRQGNRVPLRYAVPLAAAVALLALGIAGYKLIDITTVRLTVMSWLPGHSNPGAITSVDFTNATLDLSGTSCEEMTRTRSVTLVQGSAQVGDVFFNLRAVSYGSITGKDQNEAAVVINCGNKAPTDVLLLYVMKADRPVRLAAVALGSAAFGGLHAMAVADGSVVVAQYGGEARCCPTEIVESRWSWKDSRWTQVGEPVKRPFPETPQTGSKLPQAIGQCGFTTVTSVGDRLQGDHKSGSLIRYANGGHQESLSTMPAFAASRAGDEIRLCLNQVPSNCPRGDRRGRIYNATNMRTLQSWEAADSLRQCGGA